MNCRLRHLRSVEAIQKVISISRLIMGNSSSSSQKMMKIQFDLKFAAKNFERESKKCYAREKKAKAQVRFRACHRADHRHNCPLIHRPARRVCIISVPHLSAYTMAAFPHATSIRTHTGEESDRREQPGARQSLRAERSLGGRAYRPIHYAFKFLPFQRD